MMIWFLTIVVCFATPFAFPQTQPSASAQRKFQHIEQNAKLRQPDQTPTVLTQSEVNAYLASGEVNLPEGVKSVRFQGKPGMIEAFARVDFDQITASRRSSNPLLRLFTGTHDLHVMARAKGAGGMGEAHVESVEMDGVTVPRAALQFFLERYITPKYPEVALDTSFRLPYKIDLAIVGDQQLTITQK
jgi:hypothetical protein